MPCLRSTAVQACEVQRVRKARGRRASARCMMLVRPPQPSAGCHCFLAPSAPAGCRCCCAPSARQLGAGNLLEDGVRGALLLHLVQPLVLRLDEAGQQRLSAHVVRQPAEGGP